MRRARRNIERGSLCSRNNRYAGRADRSGVGKLETSLALHALDPEYFRAKSCF